MARVWNESIVYLMGSPAVDNTDSLVSLEEVVMLGLEIASEMVEFADECRMQLGGTECMMGGGWEI